MTIVIALIEWVFWTAVVSAVVLPLVAVWGWWLQKTDYKRIPRRKAQAIERDYVATKHRLNDIAGQSWRNLAG